MSMSKTEREVIINVIERIRGGSASDEITAMLQDRMVKLFLETWVIGPLEMIAVPEMRDPELALRMSR